MLGCSQVPDTSKYSASSSEDGAGNSSSSTDRAAAAEEAARQAREAQDAREEGCGDGGGGRTEGERRDRRHAGADEARPGHQMRIKRSGWHSVIASHEPYKNS